MKTVITIGRYWPSPGGAELLAKKLADGLSGLNYDVHVITLATTATNDVPSYSNLPEPDTGGDAATGARVSILTHREIIRLVLSFVHLFIGKVRGAGRLYRYILQWTLRRELSPTLVGVDVVYSIFQGYDLYLANAMHSVCKLQGVPFVFQPLCHQNSLWEAKGLLKLYREADSIVAFTESEKRWIIERGASPSRIHVIHPAPILDAVDDSPKSRSVCASSDTTVLFLGRKSESKGFNHLFRATARVFEEHQSVRFGFVGLDTKLSLEMFSTADSRIINFGVVDEEAKAELLRQCDIVCVPSIEESLGMVYLEAWSFAKPVIACRIPCLIDLFNLGEGGILVDQDEVQISEAIITLLGDSNLRVELGKRGENVVRQHFSWSKTLEATDRMLRSHIASK